MQFQFLQIAEIKFYEKVSYGGLWLYMLYKVEFLLKHYLVFVLNSIATH